MTNPVPVVILDMDGLLIDSEPFWRKAEQKVFATVGISLTEDDCRLTTGFRFDEVVDYWWRMRPWQGKSKEQIVSEVLDEMEHFITTMAQPMPGVYEALEYFKRNHCQLALASSSAMRLIQATISRLNIKNYFEVLVSAESEPYGKPHPGVYLRAAELLHTSPLHCIAIEDSLNGLIAAKAARMRCIVVPHPDEYDKPHWVIADDKWRSLHDAELPGKKWFL
ncbi:MAG: hexitol phosphatase HxpB [Chitinophagales bacterium]|nr:hexitol phosphatase HxpB [Chitinophagales bacterium]MDW8417994.1 hexitol phosphatase HxpB [Chitinophagales bacterium]